MMRLIVISMAITIGAGVMAIGYGLTASASSSSSGALGPGEITVEIDIVHSHFAIDEFVVRPGTDIRFVVRNHDPIRHELIVGPSEVHLRHASGNEAHHPPVPGEVSVDPGKTAETIYRFEQIGAMEFACHLPGHYQYGMTGWVQIVA
jgi:uncharacterized cupredoxin-like copper-binding protein